MHARFVTTVTASLCMFLAACGGEGPVASSGGGGSGAALVAAAREGDVPGVTRLIDAGVPIDAERSSGTALLAAVEADRLPVVRLLLERGANVNAQAANLDTPWLLAGALGRDEMLRLMIPRGPDLGVRNRFGGTALIPACERGHVETVRVLLATPLDVDHVNNLGWTCLLEAVILGDGGPRHRQIVAMVLDAGADPALADREGVTPLQHAERRGQRQVGQLIRQAVARRQSAA